LDRRQAELEGRVKALEAQVEALMRQQGEGNLPDEIRSPGEVRSPDER
jgi:hypothetical protein